MKPIMRKLGGLLIAMIAMVLMTSCDDDKDVNTKFSYGYNCSQTLLDFVKIEATYTNTDGEEVVVPLNTETMDHEDHGSSDTNENGEDVSDSKNRLYWNVTAEHNHAVDAQLTIRYTKIEGIDYSQYQGKKMDLYFLGYVHKYETISDGDNITLNYYRYYAVAPDFGIIYGDELEKYIDKLVSSPKIIDTTKEENKE